MATSVLPTNLAFTLLSTLYLSFGLHNLLVSAPLVQRFGARPCLFLGSLVYVALELLYVVSLANADNEFLQWMLLVPASIFSGLGAAVLWAAQGPEPGLDDENSAVPPAEDGSPPPLLGQTFATIRNPKMIRLSALFYMVSLAQAFFSGSLPLFFHTDDTKGDLSKKLYLFAFIGCSNAAGSFLVGPLTDRLGPRAMVVAEAALHAATVSWLTFGDVVNRPVRLYAAGLALGFCQATLMNQIYKLLPLLFPGAGARAPAFSAYRFHGALASGACFLLSRMLLGSDGVPRMAAWAPLLLVFLVIEVAGVFAAMQLVATDREAEDVVPTAERQPTEESPLLGEGSDD
ncbi:hypothetical protein HK405_011146 [Cladochytrium tenue]|nr:hypothetical protein HK405_011146 [Cladochytrium tenue]